MIRYNSIFNNKTLNIFTDASVLKLKGETIGSPGYVAVVGENIISERSEILRCSTNNQSEIYAILMAIQLAFYNKDKFEVINIFSDSQFAIYGLREWIFKWINNIYDDRLHNYAGALVANQKIFMNIIYIILDNDLKINFYHNRGHFKNNQVNEFIRLFTKHNFLNDYIDYQSAYKIMYYNDKVDNNTRSLLHSTNEFPPKLEILDYLARSNLDMNRYKELLNIK